MYCAERYAEARRKYDQVAEQGGITPEALQALAFCQFKTGEVERAQNTYKQLLAYDPENELTKHNLSVTENTLRRKPAYTRQSEFQCWKQRPSMNFWNKRISSSRPATRKRPWQN